MTILAINIKFNQIFFLFLLLFFLKVSLFGQPSKKYIRTSHVIKLWEGKKYLIEYQVYKDRAIKIKIEDKVRDSIYFKVLRERQEYGKRDKYVFGKYASLRNKYGIEIRKAAFDSLLNQTYILLQDSVSPAWAIDTCITMVRIYNSILINRLYELSNKTDQLRYYNYRLAIEGRKDDIWRVIAPELYESPWSVPYSYYHSDKYDLFWGYYKGMYKYNENSIYSVLNPKYKSKKFSTKRLE